MHSNLWRFPILDAQGVVENPPRAKLAAGECELCSQLSLPNPPRCPGSQRMKIFKFCERNLRQKFEPKNGHSAFQIAKISKLCEAKFRTSNLSQERIIALSKLRRFSSCAKQNQGQIIWAKKTIIALPKLRRFPSFAKRNLGVVIWAKQRSLRYPNCEDFQAVQSKFRDR